MNTFCFVKKSLIISFSALIGITSVVLGGGKAKADYIPPQEQEAPSDYIKSMAAGHRGDVNSNNSVCGTKSKSLLTLLAPQTHVGQTVSTNPTLTWFVPEPEKVALEFRLFEYDRQGRPSKLIKTITNIEQSSRLQKVSLSQYEEKLKVNHKYLWQLSAYCQYSSIQSQNIADFQARADFKVVEKPASWEEKSISELSNVSVEAYASSGFWYDALDKALEMAHSQGSERELISLVEQLIKVETTSSQDIGMILSDCLKQIISINIKK